MGKIIKNIILVLIAFLIISGIIAAFTDNSNVKVVPLSDITALINDNKVESIEVDQDKVMKTLRDFFRPEFLNRLDEIIIFDMLNEENIKDIVQKQVAIVQKRLHERGIVLTLSDKALGYLAKKGYSPQYGARPLKRLIQTQILTPVASAMISQGLMAGGTVTVDFATKKGSTDEYDGELTFVVKKLDTRPKKRSREEIAKAA